MFPEAWRRSTLDIRVLSTLKSVSMKVHLCINDRVVKHCHRFEIQVANLDNGRTWFSHFLKKFINIVFRMTLILFRVRIIVQPSFAQLSTYSWDRGACISIIFFSLSLYHLWIVLHCCWSFDIMAGIILHLSNCQFYSLGFGGARS